MRTVAIIQARLGSTRLPGKVLFEVAGQPLIGLMLNRVKRCRTVDEIIVATGEGVENDAIEGVVASLGYPVFRGSENNVLARYARAANAFKADVVVRLTGDCPLMDPGVVDLLVRTRAEQDLDFCTNVLPPTWPDGLDVAVFTSRILTTADKEAEKPSEREHVVPWMWHQTPLKGGTRFKGGNVPSPVDLSHHRWTIDEASDLLFLRALASFMGSEGLIMAGYRDLLDVLQRNPRFREMNSGITRDEGYAKSLAQEGNTKHGK